MTEALIRIDRLTVRYGAAPALRDATLDVPRGSLVAVVGPNGSGKTTLLRAINALVPPSDGGVYLDGRAVTTLGAREVARLIGAVPQEAGPGHGFTAWEIVMMGRTPRLGRLERERPLDAAAARAAMERTRTWEVRDRPFDGLSGGERQRVVLARALAQEPAVLLLDEPTAHLDVRAQLEIMDLLAGLRRDGSTIVAAIHDLNLASLYADLMVLLDRGAIAAMGEPSNVVTREHLRRVYGADVVVRPHPRSGRPYVTVLRREPARGAAGLRVHVLCGGGTARSLLEALVAEGYDVRIGPVNLMDSDLEAARALGVPAVEEAPFSPLGDESLAQARRWIATSDALVLTAVPFGSGNAALLDLAREAREHDLPLVLIDAPVGDRDFTGGEAARGYAGLREGAVACADEAAAVEVLRGLAVARAVGRMEASHE